MGRLSRSDNRGMILIGSYFVLAFFLVYSNTVTMRTLSQQVATNQLRDRLQAEDVAQGAAEQFRDNFYTYFISDIYQDAFKADAVKALAWLDDLGAHKEVVPPYELTKALDIKDSVEGSGLAGTDPRWIVLPSGRQLDGQPSRGEAWLVSVTREDPANNLSPRLMTVEARATVGGTTKRFRAVYRMAFQVSDIFKYAYFLNNYGYFDIRGPNTVTIQGDVRSNGDLDLTSDVVTKDHQLSKIKVNGDLYASENKALGAKGEIGGDGQPKGNPLQAASWYDYWANKDPQARPSLIPTMPDANDKTSLDNNLPPPPPIQGGTPSLPEGTGWDSAYNEQHRKEGLPIQDMPYLGNLDLYKTWAVQHKNSAGSSLNYVAPGADGKYNTADDVYDQNNPPVRKIYAGPDGVVDNNGNGDDTTPLVLVGTPGKPIVIDGPVVVPGDVIIVGNVTGRGTIYAGRNVHVLGSLTMEKPPKVSKLLRLTGTGEIKDENYIGGLTGGRVCQNGQYVPVGGTVPGGCI